MTLGNTLVFKCPKCGKYSTRGSLRSGNTIGALYFSDGKMIVDMLPEFPEIIKCNNCKTFYWLNDENKVGECNLHRKCAECSRRYILGIKDKDRKCIFYREFFKRKMMKKQINVNNAEFLTINEYYEAINSKFYANDIEQKYLRIKLWHAINDKFRYDAFRNENNFDMTEDEKGIYDGNCKMLIGLLDNKKIDNKIMCAELHRNIGNFTECKNILETINDEKYLWIKKLLENECDENNKKVIQIKK